jgi:hypothetical protein
MGDTPQRLANEASLPKRSGLSPATISSVAAWPVPMAGREISSGATRDDAYTPPCPQWATRTQKKA